VNRGVAALVLALSAACGAPSETVHREAEGALGPYSGSVDTGALVFVSGKIGERGGSFRREVETAIAAVEAELERSGLDLSDVVQSTVYLTDMALYGVFNEVYAASFPAPYPARACVAVAALPARARVEVMVVARRE
jgi:2-iminobutanoate/2-iminopropanoate deaminase